MKKTVVLAASLLALATSCDDVEERRSARGAAVSTPPTTSATSPSPAPPRFSARILEIDAATRERMSSSWRPGCPVPLADLRLLRLTHWGFDAESQIGEIVVHEDVATNVVEVFENLFDARFPIRRMRLVDAYGADDARSMRANNTSAFNCRRSTGDATAWSEHAYGRAIDINPIQNPYMSSGGAVDPPAGRAYRDRRAGTRGLIEADGIVVRAFRAIGWSWGGTWERSKDYQHFSRSGR